MPGKCIVILVFIYFVAIFGSSALSYDNGQCKNVMSYYYCAQTDSLISFDQIRYKVGNGFIVIHAKIKAYELYNDSRNYPDHVYLYYFNDTGWHFTEMKFLKNEIFEGRIPCPGNCVYDSRNGSGKEQNVINYFLVATDCYNNIFSELPREIDTGTIDYYPTSMDLPFNQRDKEVWGQIIDYGLLSKDRGTIKIFLEPSGYDEDDLLGLYIRLYRINKNYSVGSFIYGLNFDGIKDDNKTEYFDYIRYTEENSNVLNPSMRKTGRKAQKEVADERIFITLDLSQFIDMILEAINIRVSVKVNDNGVLVNEATMNLTYYMQYHVCDISEMNKVKCYKKYGLE